MKQLAQTIINHLEGIIEDREKAITEMSEEIRFLNDCLNNREVEINDLNSELNNKFTNIYANN